MSTLLEIPAKFRGERMRFNNANGDVIIGDCQPVDPASESAWLTIKGPADVDELHPGTTYRFYGKYVNYTHPRTKATERQFQFSSFVESAPYDEEGIISYLCRAGEGNNIGKATAKRIFSKFGAESVAMLRENPVNVATQIKRLTLAQCDAASDWLKERVAMEHTTLELTSLLTGRGFPKETGRAAIKEWGNEANEIIRKNTYALMTFRACGFKRCDALYLDLGLRPARLLRQALCAWYTVAADNNGHTWYPINWVLNGLAQSISGADVRPVAALKMAKRIGRLNPDYNGALAFTREEGGAIIDADAGGKLWAATGRKASNEQRLSELVAIAEAEKSESLWPEVAEIPNIDDHQREALKKATSGGPIAILGGGPGTGKTFVAANLIKTLANIVGYENIAVAAPTGKAAVRISEVMEGYGIPKRARTIHSLLGFAEQGFAHDESYPWGFKFIVLDETSMNDTDLMRAVFSARSRGCHILLVGDINQLPPVGHGAPLRDFITGRLPYGELTEIKRNSGGIVEACAAIRNVEPWQAGDNLAICETPNPPSQIELMTDELAEQAAGGLDPIWDCQVLVAVNEKSPLSRSAVNQVLQSKLNSAGKSHKKNNKFRVGDKVVNLKNGFFPVQDGQVDSDDIETNDSNEVYVANGELAKVIEVHEKYCVVEVQSPKRIVRVTSGASWDLGYALSVHKSQGSEWPVVIVMIDEYPGAKMVCDRSWLYTAISRAKKYCVLVGKKHVADSMVTKNSIAKRKTFLRERIELERAKKGLAVL